MTARNELFSYRTVAGSRTYFFDVKETQEGVKYLVISESRQKGSAHEHHRIMVFEENIARFANSLKQAIDFLEHQD